MHFIPPDEDNVSFQPQDQVKPNKELREPSNKVEGHLSTLDMDTKFILNDVKRIHEIETDPEPTLLMPKDELLRWHHKLGHLSFERLESMAEHVFFQGGWQLVLYHCVPHVNMASR